MRNILSIVICLFISTVGCAQPFFIQANGYSSDPRFIKLIKDRKYLLVGRFDTVYTKPLSLYAKVLKGSRWIALDQKGKEIYPFPEPATMGAPYLDDGDGNYQELLFTYQKPFDILEADGKEGVFNIKTKETIVPALYDKIRISLYRFFVYKVDGKWGIMDSTGAKITQPAYDEVRSLARNYKGKKTWSGQAEIVRLGERWGLLSPNGREILKPQFAEIQSFANVSNVLAVKSGDKWGMVNKAGQILIPPTYASINSHYPDGSAVVESKINNQSKYGLIDSAGKEILKPEYDQIRYYSFGKYKVSVAGNDGSTTYGIYDRAANEVLKPEYSSIYDLVRNKAVIISTKQGKSLQGLIDSTGKIIVKPQYSSIDRNTGRETYIVESSGKYGLIDQNERFLLQPVYEELSSVYSDIILAKLDGKYGLVNGYGKTLLSCKYDHVEVARSRKHFIYKLKDKWGLASAKGEVTKAIYDYVFDLNRAGFGFDLNGKYGVMNSSGKIILPPAFENELDDTEDGFISTIISGRKYLIDLYGNKILAR